MNAKEDECTIAVKPIGLEGKREGAEIDTHDSETWRGIEPY